MKRREEERRERGEKEGGQRRAEGMKRDYRKIW